MYYTCCIQGGDVRFSKREKSEHCLTSYWETEKEESKVAAGVGLAGKLVGVRRNENEEKEEKLKTPKTGKNGKYEKVFSKRSSRSIL